MLSHTSFAAGGPDSSGYLNAARLFSAGAYSTRILPLEQLGLSDSFADVFVPLGFSQAQEARHMVPAYPPGAALHFWLMAQLFGWSVGPYIVSPLAAAGAVVLMYFVGCQFNLRRFPSAIGAGVLAFLPPFLLHAFQPVSDVIATFWTLFVVFAAYRSRVDGRFAVVAGAAFAIGVCVRPSNILLALPLVCFLRLKPNLLVRSVVGALPIGAALMTYSSLVYGSPFRTGYGTVGEVVSLDYLDAAFRMYIRWGRRMLTGIIMPSGLAVVFSPFVAAWDRLSLFVWFFAFFAFYCFWGGYQEWWYMRFLLPALPALIIGALLLIQNATDMIVTRFAHGFVWRLGVWLFVAFYLIQRPLDLSTKLGVYVARDNIEVYPGAVHWCESQMPPNAILISGVLSGAVYYYTSRFTVRHDLLHNGRFEELRAYAGNAGLRWYALLSDVEITPHEMRERLGSGWEPIGRYRDVTLWRLAQ
ncbi:MAG: hypothetical protein JJE51_07240 [Thermoanaerobaculia bacterium]|nr:hypothetical protein [Thermoanaerobaculia bacterium]